MSAYSSCCEICLDDLKWQKRDSKSSCLHVIRISSRRLMCMCSMGIIENAVLSRVSVHVVSGTLGRQADDLCALR